MFIFLASTFLSFSFLAPILCEASEVSADSPDSEIKVQPAISIGSTPQ